MQFSHTKCFQSIQDQECEVEITKLAVEKARDKLAQAKLRLREQMKGGEGGSWRHDYLFILIS